MMTCRLCRKKYIMPAQNILRTFNRVCTFREKWAEKKSQPEAIRHRRNNEKKLMRTSRKIDIFLGKIDAFLLRFLRFILEY